ncbi:hypothetical protein ACLOJK_011846 [Asimina triloba]
MSVAIGVANVEELKTIIALLGHGEAALHDIAIDVYSQIWKKAIIERNVGGEATKRRLLPPFVISSAIQTFVTSTPGALVSLMIEGAFSLMLEGIPPASVKVAVTTSACWRVSTPI